MHCQVKFILKMHKNCRSNFCFQEYFGDGLDSSLVCDVNVLATSILCACASAAAVCADARERADVLAGFAPLVLLLDAEARSTLLWVVDAF